MKRLATILVAVGVLLTGFTVAWVAADAPVAYDEYNNGSKVRDWNILPGTDCLTAGGTRRLVPDGQPLSVCTVATTTTVAPTTTTVAPTTTTSPPTVNHIWTDVDTGSNREPALAPDASQPPNSTGVCFERNGVFNRCDATPNPYQMYPPMTLAVGDTLRASWTSGGVAREAIHVVGGAPVPTTTQPAGTTTPPTSTTQPPPSGGGFVETFDGNSGLDRFVTGVHHRDDFAWTDSWSADHDMNCGSPATQRVVHRDHPEESFYLCADHLMTSMGDASSYTVAWFEPDADGDGVGDVFNRDTVDTVSFDVNVTDLGQRQWWEVVIVPAGYQSGFDDCPHCAVHWSVSPSPSNLPAYPSRTSALGSGPLGNDGMLVADGDGLDPLGWCHINDCVDPEGAESKMIRRSFSMHDNGDGTLTFEFFGTRTYPGSFPDEFRVVFKDHNYTPSKDGEPAGFTWHWDTIAIT